MEKQNAEDVRNYFSADEALKEFTYSFGRHLAKLQKATIAKFINPENMQRLRHGGQWSHPGSPQVEDGSLQQHSALAETPFKDIADHDLTVIDRNFQTLVSQMERQFAQMVYSKVSAAAHRVGNVVNTKSEGSMENALIAMLEKIELSVDRNGKVSMPEMHVGPEAFKLLQPIFTRESPEFSQRFKDIREKKVAEAIIKEEERKQKFLRYGQ